MPVITSAFTGAVQSGTALTTANPAQPGDMTLCWYGEPIGRLHVDNDRLTWRGYASAEMETLFSDIFPARASDGLPVFVEQFDPGNPVFQHRKENAPQSFQACIRYLSNITLSSNAPWDQPVSTDKLKGRLESFTRDGIFTGSVSGINVTISDENSMAEELAPMWDSRHMPRMSGTKIKLPVTLDEQGKLQPATGGSFTHFIKFPTSGIYETIGFNEWTGLQLSEAIGLSTAKAALVPLGNDQPALLVERFDIVPPDGHRVILQDFCDLAERKRLPTKRDEGSMEQIAKIMRKYSTDLKQDMETLYKRLILSWTLNDNDMDRRNVAMIFEYDPQQKTITSARLAPTFDVVPDTDLKERESAIALGMQGGKRKNLKREDFVRFGQSLGLDEARANVLLDETVATLAVRATAMTESLPPIAADNPACIHAARRIATLAVEKAEMLGLDVPSFEKEEARPVHIPLSKLRF